MWCQEMVTCKSYKTYKHKIWLENLKQKIEINLEYILQFLILGI